MTFHLSHNLKLPTDAVTQTFAILAKRGVGKTHAATVLAEEMLSAGQPIVAYDPTSAWWGLKSSRDGKRPGFPVVIFGGEHADVPLEESAGATIATVIVEKRIPAVLDVGLLRKGARVRFMTDFCETLYHKNREALHFFADEAHTICPQNIRAMPEAARLLGAMEDIVLQGRRRGLGVTVISQRPALVNKNVTTQCEVLVAMQLTGAHDRKAIEEWVDAHGDDAAKGREMLGSLSSLQCGEAWVWSPGWLRGLTRTTFRDRTTFDSSATPKVGGRIVTPKSVAEVDLAALGEQIKATVERAKADDPKELRRQIAELKKLLAERPVPAADPATIERAVNAAMAKRDKEWQAAVGEREFIIDRLKTQMYRAVELLHVNGESDPKPVKLTSSQQVSKASKPAPTVKERPLAIAPLLTDGPFSKAERAILGAIYWLQDGQTTPAKVGFYADYTAGSGSFNNALGRLRSTGLIAGWQITAAGQAAAEQLGIGPKPAGSDLREWLRRKLGKAENALLDALVAAHPHRLPDDELGAASGYTAGSGSFNNALGRLRSIEAAEGYARDGGAKASDVFFET